MASTEDDTHDGVDVSDVTAGSDHLLTVAIPPEESVDEALERAEQRHDETQYLQAETEARVEDALAALHEALDGDESPPENGLVAYAGVVDGDTVAETTAPSSPVQQARFERGDEFETEMVDGAGKSAPAGSGGGSRTYGLLVVEHGKAALGRLAEGEVTLLERFEGDRAEENPTEGSLGDREQEHREFFDRVARAAGRAFIGEDPDEVEEEEAAAPGESEAAAIEGLLVGGSSVTAAEFLDGDYLDHRLQGLVVGDAFAVGDATADGLEQLAGKASGRIERREREAIREVLGEFLAALADDEDEAVAGREAVEEALEYEGVDTALAVATLPDEDRRDLADRTAAQGGEFVVVPTDLEGSDRLQAEGPVGALTRFPIE